MNDDGIYQRYFRVTGPELLEAAKEIERERKRVARQIEGLYAELGTGGAHTNRDGLICGFSKVPPRGATGPDLWRSPNIHGLYWPKRSTTGGKVLIKRIRQVPRLPTLQELLLSVGLTHASPVLFSASCGYYCRVLGTAKSGILIISVPWRDGGCKSAGFDISESHLEWTPPAGLVEIKKWEALRDLEGVE